MEFFLVYKINKNWYFYNCPLIQNTTDNQFIMKLIITTEYAGGYNINKNIIF